MNLLLFSLVPAVGALAIFIAAMKAIWVLKQDNGNAKMRLISAMIANGASAFLKAEYSLIAIFCFPVCLMLVWMGYSYSLLRSLGGGAFILGALFSAVAGVMGMRMATAANVRTAKGAEISLARAFAISFSGGGVMGLAVVGLALLGIGGLFALGVYVWGDGHAELLELAEFLTGFALGGETIALFARVAGGIYTKAADVGADIVGKTEEGLEEDDPRNPATIADNVGDNVGDVAGMGADLFGSYVSTLLAAMILGVSGGMLAMSLPMFVGMVGVICVICVMQLVRVSSEQDSVQGVLDRANGLAMLLTAGVTYLLLRLAVPHGVRVDGVLVGMHAIYATICIGLFIGWAVGMITTYYTAVGYRPVNSIVKQSVTGAATNIIAGLSLGMESTVLPVLLFAAGIWGAYQFAGYYGVAMAAVGMMSTTGLQLAMDAFGPIADNAGGIAEMAGLHADVRRRTDILDAVGNTTAAAGKGFAIASAALTSLALFAVFVRTTGLRHIDLARASVLSGLLVGGMVPFLFSALCMRAVGGAAMDMVHEVRRQLRDIVGLREGKVSADYGRCISIATHAALWGMCAPAALAIGGPILVGLVGGAEVLASFLAGVMVSGIMMAILQCNAGGGWDNAKKAIEKGVMIDGVMHGKGGDVHRASVVGDTVGDPCKDTSGPAMNILIKLSTIVALIMAPYLSVSLG